MIGTYYNNHILNTITYDIEFPNGEVREYTTNVIAENMLIRVYLEGYITLALD